MEAKLQRHFDSKLKLQDFCVINDDPLSLLIEYPVLIILLNLIINKIHAAVAINKANLKHFATNKEILQRVMVDIVWRYQLRARVFARNNNLPDIYQSLKFEKSYMLDNDDATVIDRAKEIMKIMKTHLSLLTNLTQANITEMEASIAACEENLLSPEEAIKDRKAYGTDLIPGLLKEADVVTDDIGDLVESYLEDLYPDWLVRAKIGKATGTRHQSISIKYLDAATKAPLKKVKTTITNATGTITQVFYSTKAGCVTIYSLETGNWTITSEYQNYITDTKANVGVFDKKVAKFEIKLQLHTAPTPPESTAEPTPPTSEITPTPEPSPTPEPTPPSE
ncbi:MAG: hypothetical protein WCH34_00035 [Bacteroidota bacterium]